MGVLSEAKSWHSKTDPWMVQLLKDGLPPEFEQMQADAKWWAVLTKWAELSFVLENINFLDQTTAFTVSRNLTMAPDIYNEYIVVGAPSQVNINEKLIGPIREAIEEDEPDVEMFDEAVKEVITLTKNGTYKDFLADCRKARPELLAEDEPEEEEAEEPAAEVAKEIGDPKLRALTRDKIDMAVVDNFNKTALTDLVVGASMTFYQSGDLVIIQTAMGEDQPYVKWIKMQGDVTTGANVTKTAKAGAFSSGTFTVSGARDKDAFKKAVARVSKAKIVFA